MNARMIASVMNHAIVKSFTVNDGIIIPSIISPRHDISNHNWLWNDNVTHYESLGYWGGEIVGSVVPVPAAVWLFGSALAGLGWIRRKQTQQA